MGERWPTTWLKFATAIREGSGQQVTPKHFWDAMTHHNVSADGQPVLANWLHELGDILFFQDDDDVNDLVILKPQWVTEYISKVLTAEPVIANNGIFTRQCMNDIWSDLKPGLRDFFLRLMERFDLSYRTLENRDISLVVERLPFEPPNFQDRWTQKKAEPNCKEISMKFQLSEILPGIPTWFIARQHRFTIEEGERRGIHWRTGVLFQDREGKHLGLVRTLRDENTNADYLHLTVRGPVPHNFFDILREGLELTLHRYPGLKITRLLPCPDPINTDCLHEFDYANLTRRLERTPPRETIECPNCLEDISVTSLLFGLHYTTQNTVIAKLDQLQASSDTLQTSVEQGFTELRELVQRDLLREIRITQKQIESPCPSVFVLRPDNRKPWQKNPAAQRINLQLYCEHPGCLHPVQSGGLYPIDNPKKWLKVMAPHLNRLFGILKYVTPVVGPWVNVADADYGKLIKNDLALTQSLVAKLPTLSLTDDDRSFAPPEERLDREDHHLRKVSGAPLRTLHEFLKRKDPDQVWGGLTRTTTPEGDVLWLCQEHIKEIYPTSSKPASSKPISSKPTS
ncbi:MAG: COR domain-containing protein [Cyanobacteria bacterium P01_F01_bin.53]